jgi:hypothetical protein
MLIERRIISKYTTGWKITFDWLIKNDENILRNYTPAVESPLFII